MNLKELATNLELEEGEFLELIHIFMKTTDSELGNLGLAMEEKDVPVVERLAHSIKGGAGSLGLTEIQDAAKRIEAAARENHLMDWDQDIRTIRANLDRIEETLKRGNQNVKV